MDQNLDNGQVHEQKVVNHHSKNKLKSLRDKLPSDKKRLVVLGLIVLALPLTVALALVQQELRSRASEYPATPATPPGNIENPISWTTDQVSLSADDIYIDIDGKRFVPSSDVSYSSSPSHPMGDGYLYTDIYADWYSSDQVPMHLYLDFKFKPGSFWQLYQVRTLDGKTFTKEVFYNPVDEFGQPIQNSLGDSYVNGGEINFLQQGTIVSSAKVHLKNIHITPFKDMVPTPTRPSVTSAPTPTPIAKPFKIVGKHVDANGNLINLPGLGVSITNLSTNQSQEFKGSTWTLDNLPRVGYQITANQIPGYKIEHMVCYECMDTDRFFPSNTFTLGASSSDFVGITFRYIPTPAPTNKTLILNPTADAFVRSSAPNQNFGTNTNLRNDTSPNEISFIRFNLTPLAGKTIVSAKLKIKVSDATSKTLTLRRAANTNWSETGVTFNNKPAFEAVITTFNAATLNEIKDLNITNLVNLRKGGNVTVGITSGGDDTGAFYSREAASSNKPQLIIEYK